MPVGPPQLILSNLAHKGGATGTGWERRTVRCRRAPDQFPRSRVQKRDVAHVVARVTCSRTCHGCCRRNVGHGPCSVLRQTGIADVKWARREDEQQLSRPNQTRPTSVGSKAGSGMEHIGDDICSFEGEKSMYVRPLLRSYALYDEDCVGGSHARPPLHALIWRPASTILSAAACTTVTAGAPVAFPAVSLACSMKLNSKVRCTHHASTSSPRPNTIVLHDLQAGEDGFIVLRNNNNKVSNGDMPRCAASTHLPGKLLVSLRTCG